MAHVQGVQDPATAIVHTRHTDDHRLRTEIQPALQVQGIVVDARVFGIVRQVTNVLEAVSRGGGRS